MAAPIGGIGGSGRALMDGIGGSGRAPNDGNLLSFFSIILLTHTAYPTYGGSNSTLEPYR